MASDPNIPPIHFPAPFDPAGRRPSEPSPRPQAPIEIRFPPSPDPVTSQVFRGAIRSLGEVVGDVFPWPRSVPLTITVTNTHDVPITAEIYVNPDTDTSRRTAEPAVAFDIGPGGRRAETLNPDGDDQWAPYAFCVLRSKTSPAAGDVNVTFSRPG